MQKNLCASIHERAIRSGDMAIFPRQARTRKLTQSILIVEDNVLLGEILQTELEMKGAEATQCISAGHALETAQNKNFDVFIVDYRMPDMNGLEVVKRLRAKCPQSLIMGISIENREQDFIDAGANIFLTKPFEMERMLSAIEGHPRMDD